MMRFATYETMDIFKNATKSSLELTVEPKSVIRNFCEQNVRQWPLLWPKFTLHTLIIAIIMTYFTQNESPIF